MEEVLQYIKRHSQGLTELTTKIDQFEARLRNFEQKTQTNAPPVHFNHTVSAAEPELSLDEDLAPRSSRKPDLEDHRTAPHKLLLLWPSVRPLLKRAGVNCNDAYVMEAEDRGVVRLWPQGEGIDAYDGTQPGGYASPAQGDASGDAAYYRTLTEGMRGMGSPSTSSSNAGRSEPYGVGGLNADSYLDLDAQTVLSLYKSYMRNIYVMHPFLDKRQLDSMFDKFIRRYSSRRPQAARAVGNDDNERLLKRQRSNTSGAARNIGGGSGSEPDLPREAVIERSPSNAIIYLVIALGKICQHKDALPSIVPNSQLEEKIVVHQISGSRGSAGSSPMSANMEPPPVSPTSTSTSQTTSPSDGTVLMLDLRSPRASLKGFSTTFRPRNLDVIPGMAYYAEAAEIIGD